jgi:hypothetical protein
MLRRARALGLEHGPHRIRQSKALFPMYELKYFHAEKRVARRAFDLALGQELEALVLEAKDRDSKDRRTL